MNDKVIRVTPGAAAALSPVVLLAGPEPLEINLQRTVVIVIDMQNAFISKGGMFDLWDRDVSKNQEVIQPIKKITEAARAKGVKVVYTAAEYQLGLHDTGGPNSPNWYKSTLPSYREHPEWRDKLVFHGTWGADIVDELTPQEGDILVTKTKYSAFFGTNLDIILKTLDAKYLVFVGVATNICVEASIRDAYYREYFPILVADSAMYSGPACTQEATIYNVQRCYGWVTTTQNIVNAME